MSACLVLLVALAGIACSASRRPVAAPPVARPRHPNEVLEVAFAGGTVYARTLSQRLRVWVPATGAVRTLDREGVVALSADGTVALVVTPPTGEEKVIEAWEPSSGKILGRRELEAGLWGLRAVSRRLAVLDIGRVVERSSPHEAPPQVPAPDHDVIAWDLSSGMTASLSVDKCQSVSFSRDGLRLVCDTFFIDRGALTSSWPPILAPEWSPPPSRQIGEDALELDALCAKCEPVDHSDVYVLSTWLSRDGRAVYLTYNGVALHREWRLERWIPDPAGRSSGTLQRLAAVREDLSERVLGASANGQVIVTADSRRVTPTVWRRAPTYAPQGLPAAPASAAAFSDDDTQLVTGYDDGTLRLWDVRTGRLLATGGGS